MAAQINIRQELLCYEYLKRGNKVEAWQKVYGTPNRASARTLASRTLGKPHVKRHLDQLQRRMMDRKQISAEKVLTDYQDAIDLAKSQGRAADIIAGASAQAKLVGLLRDRVETGSVGDFGDANSIEDVLGLVAKEAGQDAAMTLAAMFGLKMPESQTSKAMKEAVLFISDPGSDSVN